MHCSEFLTKLGTKPKARRETSLTTGESVSNAATGIALEASNAAETATWTSTSATMLADDEDSFGIEGCRLDLR